MYRCPGILKYIKSVRVIGESSEKEGFWNTMTISIISVVGAVVLATIIVIIALAATGKFKHKKNNEAFVVPLFPHFCLCAVFTPFFFCVCVAHSSSNAEGVAMD